MREHNDIIISLTLANRIYPAHYGYARARIRHYCNVYIALILIPARAQYRQGFM